MQGNKHHRGVVKLANKLLENPHIKWLETEQIVTNGEYDIIYQMHNNLFYVEYKSNDNPKARAKAIIQTHRYCVTNYEYRLSDYNKYGLYAAPGIITGLWKNTKKGGLEKLFDCKFSLHRC